MGAGSYAAHRFFGTALEFSHEAELQYTGISDLLVVGVLLDYFGHISAKADKKRKGAHCAADKKHGFRQQICE